MNVSMFSMGTDSYVGRGAVFAGTLPMLQNMGLKSTQEKMERQQKANSQIDYWEKQKENLKNMECETVEDIARKLEKFHNYEDEIAAAKMAYNNGQMFHILDEAMEQGEKIAEEVEKTKPKTPEERKEELAEEITQELTGSEQGGGVLEEVLEEAAKIMEEMQEKALEETTKEAAESLENVTRQMQDMEASQTIPDAALEDEALRVKRLKAAWEMSAKARETCVYSDMDEWIKYYRPMDVRV